MASLLLNNSFIGFRRAIVEVVVVEVVVMALLRVAVMIVEGALCGVSSPPLTPQPTQQPPTTPSL